MRRHHLTPALCVLVLAACGDDKQPGGDTTSTSLPDTSGDTDTHVTLPDDCWLPASPTASMDCDLMCRKAAACGVEEDGCRDDCAAWNYLLSPAAGDGVEACYVDSPCNDLPAALGVIGCVAHAVDDPTFQAPPASATTCAALATKLDACSVSSEARQSIDFICDNVAAALSSEVLARAAACADKPCDELLDCVGGSSCAWGGIEGEDPLPPEVDACLGTNDTNQVRTRDVLALALGCVAGCSGEANTCSQSCLVDGAELSAACSTCYAEVAACLDDECAAACSDPSAAGCFGCLTSAGCAGDFATCAGIPLPGSPDDLDCNPTDRASIATEDVPHDIVQCVAQCADGRSCANECMGVVLDVSERCAPCGGALAVCAAQACPTVCADLHDAIGCYACVAPTSCFEDFAACSGQVVGAPVGGACLAPADHGRSESGAAWAATAACVSGCVGDPASCVMQCVTDNAQVSAVCGACYTSLGGCAAPCATACGANPAGPECAACIADAGCDTTFKACAGTAPYPAVALGTESCAEAYDCAIACEGSGGTCVEDCVTKARPELISLARATAQCVRETCAGQDVSCVARTCLADYQQCQGITGTSSCDDVDACMSQCADPSCQLGCLTAASSAEVIDDFVAIGQCIERFCAPSGDPNEVTAACVNAVASDPALCGATIERCGDPSLEAAPLDCGEGLACVAFCPTQACADACVSELAATASAPLSAFYGCLQDECPSGERRCAYTSCYDPLQACAGLGSGLSCGQIFACQSACTYFSCSEQCVASASSAAAVAYYDVVQCFQDHCTGVDGQLIADCVSASQAPGGPCEAAAAACGP